MFRVFAFNPDLAWIARGEKFTGQCVSGICSLTCQQVESTKRTRVATLYSSFFTVGCRYLTLLSMTVREIEFSVLRPPLPPPPASISYFVQETFRATRAICDSSGPLFCHNCRVKRDPTVMIFRGLSARLSFCVFLPSLCLHCIVSVNPICTGNFEKQHVLPVTLLVFHFSITAASNQKIPIWSFSHFQHLFLAPFIFPKCWFNSRTLHSSLTHYYFVSQPSSCSVGVLAEPQPSPVFLPRVAGVGWLTVIGMFGYKTIRSYIYCIYELRRIAFISLVLFFFFFRFGLQLVLMREEKHYSALWIWFCGTLLNSFAVLRSVRFLTSLL